MDKVKLPIKDNNGVEMYHIELDKKLIIEIAKLLNSMNDEPEIQAIMAEETDEKSNASH